MSQSAAGKRSRNPRRELRHRLESLRVPVLTIDWFDFSTDTGGWKRLLVLRKFQDFRRLGGGSATKWRKQRLQRCQQTAYKHTPATLWRRPSKTDAQSFNNRSAFMAPSGVSSCLNIRYR